MNPRFSALFAVVVAIFAFSSIGCAVQNTSLETRVAQLECNHSEDVQELQELRGRLAMLSRLRDLDAWRIKDLVLRVDLLEWTLEHGVDPLKDRGPVEPSPQPAPTDGRK